MDDGGAASAVWNVKTIAEEQFDQLAVFRVPDQPEEVIKSRLTAAPADSKLTRAEASLPSNLVLRPSKEIHSDVSYCFEYFVCLLNDANNQSFHNLCPGIWCLVNRFHSERHALWSPGWACICPRQCSRNGLTQIFLANLRPSWWRRSYRRTIEQSMQRSIVQRPRQSTDDSDSGQQCRSGIVH